jgi:hypothetical protein
MQKEKCFERAFVSVSLFKKFSAVVRGIDRSGETHREIGASLGVSEVTEKRHL